MDLVLDDEQRNQMRVIMDFIISKWEEILGISLLRKRRNQIGEREGRRRGGGEKNERNLGISQVKNQHLKLPFFFYFH